MNGQPTAHIDSIDPDPTYDTQSVTFLGHAEDANGSSIAYWWESDLDGKLSEEANFQITGLISGTHNITFKVRADEGNSTPWSEDATYVLEVEHNEAPFPEDIGVSAPWVYRGQSITIHANGSDDLTDEKELNPEFNYQVPGTQRYAWRMRYPSYRSPAISKDGEYIALGGLDNVYLYHKDSDTALWSWPIQGFVWYMDMSEDGAYITAGTGLGTIYLIDRSNPTPLWSSTIDGSSNTIAMSADGNYVVTGSTAGTIYLFHRDSPTPLWTYSIGNTTVSNVEISANGEFIVAGGWNHILYLFHRNSSDPLWTFVKHSGEIGGIYPVGISADGEHIAAGWGHFSGEGSILLFHRDNSTPLWEYFISPDGPFSLDFTPDGRDIAVGTASGEVLLLHRDSKVPIWRYRTGAQVNSIAISAVGMHIAAGNVAGTVYRFQRDSSIPVWNCDIGAATQIDLLRLSGDGDTLVASNIDGMVHVFHRDSGGSYWSHTTDDAVRTCAISGDGEYIVAGGYDHRVYLFHRGNSDPHWSHPVPGQFVSSLDVSDDGVYIAAVSGASQAYYGGPAVEDQKVYLFHRDSDIPLWSHVVGKRESEVAISSDGAYIAVGSQGGQNVGPGNENETGMIYLFHRDNDEPVWSYPVPGNNTALSVDISADGQYIAAGRSQSELGVVGDETLIYLFHRDNPVPLWTYTVPDEFNWRGVAISAGGEYITAGNDNGTLALFHRDSPIPLWTYRTESSMVQPVISSSGEYIAAGSADGKVYLFHRDDPTPLWTFEVGQSPILALSTDGEYLTVGSGNEIFFFHRDTSTPLWTYTVGGVIAGVAVSAHGEEVSVACYDRKLYLLQGSSSAYLSDPVHTGEEWSVDFSPSLSAPLGDYQIRVRFADPHEGVGDWRYTLLDSDEILEPVEVRNNPPVATIVSIFPSSLNVGETVTFNGTGSDIDGDRRIVAYEWRSSIDGKFGNTINLSFQELSPGDHQIYFRVQDSDGDWSQQVNLTIYINAFPFASIIGNYPASIGHNETIFFESLCYDTDGNVVAYEWWSSIDGFLSSEASFTIGNLTNGTHTIELRVQDDDGAWTISDSLIISVSAPPISKTKSEISFWYILTFSILLLVCGSVVTWTIMKSRAREEQSMYLVEDVFLIYRRDGCLMIHERQSGRELIDEDVLGSMLTAMMMFIKDSFERTGHLQGMEFGDSKVLINMGEHCYLAVLVFGFPGPELKEQMEEALRSLEIAFAGMIEDWDGKRETFQTASNFLTPLLTGTSDITRAMVEAQVDASKVRVLSEREFYKGFVRLNVTVKSNTDKPMRDTVFKLKYDAMVLELVKIEPEHPLARGALHLGVIEPEEEKIITFTFDPLVCRESVLDGEMIYRIDGGRRRKAFMMQRKIDISSPIFVTTENVTLPMVKTLLEQKLDCRDTRVVHIPIPSSEEEVYGMVRDALRGLDLQLLREGTEGQESPGEKEGGGVVVAWYYGLTKEESDHVVIRATLSRERDELKFMVATSNWADVTGMLTVVKEKFINQMSERQAK